MTIFLFYDPECLDLSAPKEKAIQLTNLRGEKKPEGIHTEDISSEGVVFVFFVNKI